MMDEEKVMPRQKLVIGQLVNPKGGKRIFSLRTNLSRSD
jgi:hypothetical protein